MFFFQHKPQGIKHGRIRIESLYGTGHHLPRRRLRTIACRQHPTAEVAIGNDARRIIRH